MGAGWYFCNVDKKCSEYRCNLGEDSPDIIQDRVVKYLMRPKPNVYFQPVSTLDSHLYNFRRASTQSKTSLANVPLELFERIMSTVDFLDVICFALACQRLWDICLPIMEKLIKKDVERQSWVGNRLVFARDSAVDIPPGLLTPREKEEFLVETIRSCIAKNGRHVELPTVPDLTVVCAPRPFTMDREFEELWHGIWYRYAKSEWFQYDDNLDYAEFKKTTMKIKYADEKTFRGLTDFNLLKVARVSMILRNLSKRVYVREQAVDELAESLRLAGDIRSATNLSKLGLGSALVAQTLWSYDPPHHTDGLGRRLSDGIWAGDRFDVVSVDDFNEECATQNNPPWVDESEGAMRDMEQYLRDEFGPLFW